MLKICSTVYRDDKPLTLSLGPTSMTVISTTQYILPAKPNAAAGTFSSQHARKPLLINQSGHMSCTFVAISSLMRKPWVS